MTIVVIVLAVMAANTTLWESLERRSRTVFLVAGVLLLGYAASKAVYTFTDVTPVGAFDVAFGGIGLLVAFVAVLSFYRPLRDRTPGLSLAGAFIAVIGVVGNLALLGWLAGATLTMRGYPAIPEESPAWTVAVLIVVFITLAIAFLLFGIASLRTSIPSKTTGRLLVVPGLSWAGLILGNLLLTPGQYLGLVYVPISLALLAIGAHLGPDGVSSGRREPTADTAP